MKGFSVVKPAHQKRVQSKTASGKGAIKELQILSQIRHFIFNAELGCMNNGN